jgi:hypothetical protein
MKQTSVAVTGFGLVSPFGRGYELNSAALQAGAFRNQCDLGRRGSARAAAGVLEDIRVAEARGAKIWAILEGAAATSDGEDMVAPNGKGAVAAMELALRDAEVDRQRIDYINLHGTSTPAGDLKEIEAIRTVFGARIPSISSTKSMTGHALGAAGALEAIFCILMMQDNFLAPNINLDNPEPAVADLPVVRETRKAELAWTMSNSFGFGGTNCSLVFSHPDPDRRSVGHRSGGRASRSSRRRDGGFGQRTSQSGGGSGASRWRQRGGRCRRRRAGSGGYLARGRESGRRWLHAGLSAGRARAGMHRLPRDGAGGGDGADVCAGRKHPDASRCGCARHGPWAGRGSRSIRTAALATTGPARRRLARRGFAVDHHLAQSINGVLRRTETQSDDRFAELRRAFAPPDARQWTAGQRLVQPELAETLQRLAEGGPGAFYGGRTAELIEAEMTRGGGLITRADLASYEARLRPPVRGRYRQYEILGPPPPSSGGIAVVQALNILETFDLHTQPRFSARNLHLVAESLRRAFRDRALHLGDPDFVAIPTHLTDKQYAGELAAGIRLDRATPSLELAEPFGQIEESCETTHFSVIDADGMAVANTYTLEASWGSRIVVAGAGFVLNNEMGDFNWVPGRTDQQGRIGTPPNLIAPQKTHAQLDDPDDRQTGWPRLAGHGQPRRQDDYQHGPASGVERRRIPDGSARGSGCSAPTSRLVSGPIGHRAERRPHLPFIDPRIGRMGASDSRSPPARFGSFHLGRSGNRLLSGSPRQTPWRKRRRNPRTRRRIRLTVDSTSVTMGDMDHDQRFKTLIREFFADFLHLFFRDWAARLDLRRAWMVYNTLKETIGWELRCPR